MGALFPWREADSLLRLWGEHGQRRLSQVQRTSPLSLDINPQARVCLFNADAAGTEILKNIILPAIGSFTIVDGNMVRVGRGGSGLMRRFNGSGRARRPRE